MKTGRCDLDVAICVLLALYVSKIEIATQVAPPRPGGHWLGIVVIAATQHDDSLAFDFVDETMLQIDSSGPVARKRSSYPLGYVLGRTKPGCLR